MCPALSKRVKILDSQKRLIYQPTGSIYQVLSADVGNKHGFNTTAWCSMSCTRNQTVSSLML